MSGWVSVNNTDSVFDVTFTTDTSAYADGDVLSDTAEIADVIGGTSESVVLMSLSMLDKADQAQAMTVVFLDGNVSLGTKNSAPSITDANAENILGHVTIATDDYVDLAASQVACKTGIGLVLTPTSGSLYVALLSGGTGTYAADSLVGRFGFLR